MALAIASQHGDETARKQLIEASLRLVVPIARRYEGRRMRFPDLSASPHPQGDTRRRRGRGWWQVARRGGRLIYAPILSPFVSQRLVGFGVKHNGEDLSVLRELIEAGKVTPVVGATYPLAGVPDAMRDLQAGNSRGGKVVIAVRAEGR